MHTRADGTYAVLLKPAKNVRLRAVLEGNPVRTYALTVWAELPSGSDGSAREASTRVCA